VTPPQTPLRLMLAEKDLRSDGLSQEAAALVLQNPRLMPELVDALLDAPPAARGHTADAIERVSRTRPELIAPFLASILPLAEGDPVPMVRWHVGMLLTNQALTARVARRVVPVLMGQLADPSAFVRSWAVSGLCVIARRFPAFTASVLDELHSLERDPKISVRHRVRTAIRVLLVPDTPIPSTWVKAAGRRH